MLFKSLLLQWDSCTNDDLVISKALEMAKLHILVEMMMGNLSSPSSWESLLAIWQMNVLTLMSIYEWRIGDIW